MFSVCGENIVIKSRLDLSRSERKIILILF